MQLIKGYWPPKRWLSKNRKDWAKNLQNMGKMSKKAPIPFGQSIWSVWLEKATVGASVVTKLVTTCWTLRPARPELNTAQAEAQFPSPAVYSRRMTDGKMMLDPRCSIRCNADYLIWTAPTKPTVDSWMTAPPGAQIPTSNRSLLSQLTKTQYD